jgi:hypothetical protein
MVVTWIIGAFLLMAALYMGMSYIIAAIVAMPACRALPATPASLGMAYEDVSFPSRIDRILLRG